MFTTRVPDGPLIEQRVDIKAGERKAVSLDVRTSSAAPESPPSPEESKAPETDASRSHSLAPWMWTSFGIGAAGVITGTVSGIMLLQDRAKIMSECPSSGRQPDGTIPCKDGGYAAVERARNTLAPLTTVALSVGAAGVAAGVVLLIVDASGSHRTQARTVPLVGVAPRGATLGFATTW